jgi:hypothetical protein
VGSFSFLKYTFIIFAAHLATSCGALFENHCSTVIFFYLFSSELPTSLNFPFICVLSFCLLGLPFASLIRIIAYFRHLLVLKWSDALLCCDLLTGTALSTTKYNALPCDIFHYTTETMKTKSKKYITHEYCTLTSGRFISFAVSLYQLVVRHFICPNVNALKAGLHGQVERQGKWTSILSQV